MIGRGARMIPTASRSSTAATRTTVAPCASSVTAVSSSGVAVPCTDNVPAASRLPSARRVKRWQTHTITGCRSDRQEPGVAQVQVPAGDAGVRTEIALLASARC